MALAGFMETELIEGLLAIFAGNVQQIILYGSAARREDTAESDIDIAMILRQEITLDQRQKFLEWSAEMDTKYEKVISIVDIQEEKMVQWGEILPFYRNIQKEGIVLWKTA